jgi:hypothetical protein
MWAWDSAAHPFVGILGAELADRLAKEERPIKRAGIMLAGGAAMDGVVEVGQSVKDHVHSLWDLFNLKLYTNLHTFLSFADSSTVRHESVKDLGFTLFGVATVMGLSKARRALYEQQAPEGLLAVAETNLAQEVTQVDLSAADNLPLMERPLPPYDWYIEETEQLAEVIR